MSSLSPEQALVLTAIERYLKQAIVDKQPLVASAALVAGMKLMKTNPDVVKRWVNEVNQAANDKSASAQTVRH
jgi:coatomer protein complex subunit gamma